MSTQTPAQIAEAALPVYIGDSDTSDGFDQDDLLSFAAAAIEADRAQRHTWQVVTGGTSRYPLAIIGAYSSQFEAEAVARAWNEANNKHGIHYRVEEDA